jgi:hypothetical protein
MGLILIFLLQINQKKMCPLENNQNYIRSQPIDIPADHTDDLEDIFDNAIFDDEITPPPSPPSPPAPPPPPSPLWTQQDFDFYTTLIQKQLTDLETIIIGPHIIYIDGIQHLRPCAGQNWKDKLNSLLFEARIPFFWILDCIPDNQNEDPTNNEDEGIENENENEPRRVRMSLISHDVKNKVFQILNVFLRNEYNNIVYLA